MNIGFEAKRFFTNYTGLGNYCRFIVDALSLFARNNNHYLYTPKFVLNNETKPVLDRENVKVVTPATFYKITHSTSIWRSLGISMEPSIQQLHLFHGLSQELPLNLPTRVKKVVTMHDLIFYRYPKFYNPIDIAIYKSKCKHACKRADKIVAISKQTARDLVDFLEIHESKIEVIQQGCHPNFKRKCQSDEIKRIKAKYNLPGEYILNVGTIEERKNVIVLIKALALLPKQSSIPLVILGRRTQYFNEVIEVARRLNVLDKIIFLHNVPFSEFPAIYQGATVFVYPSLFEGFGIPLIEAIESGIPVITSKGSCFSEAAGASAIYINPLDEEELSFELINVLSNDVLRTKMVVDSKKYIFQFEPEEIARKLIVSYQSLM